MKYTIGFYFLLMNGIIYWFFEHLKIYDPFNKIVAFAAIVLSMLISLILNKTEKFTFKLKKNSEKYKSYFIPISLFIFFCLPFTTKIMSIEFEIVKLFFLKFMDKKSIILIIYYLLLFVFYIILFCNRKKKLIQSILYYFEGNYTLTVNEKKLFNKQLLQNTLIFFAIILVLVIFSFIFGRPFFLKLSALILFGYLFGVDISTYLIPFIKCEYGLSNKDINEYEYKKRAKI